MSPQPQLRGRPLNVVTAVDPDLVDQTWRVHTRPCRTSCGCWHSEAT